MWMLFRQWNSVIDESADGLSVSAIPVLAMASFFALFGLLIVWLTVSAIGWGLERGLPFVG